MARSLLLDILRIFAIVLVFVAHFGQLLDTDLGNFFGLKNFYLVSLGGLGVSIFLILSGLLAGLSDMSRPIGYFSYLLKKALRIYPLYWLTLPFTIIGYLLGGYMMKGDWLPLFPNGVAVDVISSLTGFYSWLGLWGGPYNPPSWFIALIISMYSLFPLLAFFFKRSPHAALAVLLAVSLLSRWYVGQYGVPFIPSSFLDDVEGWFYRRYGFMPGRPGDWFPPCRVFEFGLGIWLALQVKASFWQRFNIGSGKAVAFFSDLSFPLFLLHYPFLFLVPWMNNFGIPTGIAIVVVMVLLTLMAHGVSRLDSKVPRRKWVP